jgi:hypothetical protein
MKRLERSLLSEKMSKVSKLAIASAQITLNFVVIVSIVVVGRLSSVRTSMLMESQVPIFWKQLIKSGRRIRRVLRIPARQSIPHQELERCGCDTS